MGSDGILLLVPAWAGADFGLRIFNPDGSEAEKSGNGLRIFAKYLHDHGHASRPTFTVDTKGGRVECQCHVTDGRVNEVTVEMGRCTFVAPEIPMNGPDARGGAACRSRWPTRPSPSPRCRWATRTAWSSPTGSTRP